MGRPRKNIGPKRIIELIAQGYTVEEVAALEDCCAKTIYFCRQCEKGRLLAAGKIRHKQFERAIAGSDTMLIWLGEQLLGQKDKQEVETIEHSTAIEEGRAFARKMMEMNAPAGR